MSLDLEETLRTEAIGAVLAPRPRLLLDEGVTGPHSFLIDLLDMRHDQ